MTRYDTLSCLNFLSPVMRDWLDQEPLEGITNISLDREILPDGDVPGPDGQMWKKVKPGNHITMRASYGERMRSQVFVCIDDQWKLDTPTPTRVE